VRNSDRALDGSIYRRVRVAVPLLLLCARRRPRLLSWGCGRPTGPSALPLWNPSCPTIAGDPGLRPCVPGEPRRGRARRRCPGPPRLFLATNRVDHADALPRASRSSHRGFSASRTLTDGTGPGHPSRGDVDHVYRPRRSRRCGCHCNRPSARSPRPSPPVGAILPALHVSVTSASLRSIGPSRHKTQPRRAGVVPVSPATAPILIWSLSGDSNGDVIWCPALPRP